MKKLMLLGSVLTVAAAVVVAVAVAAPGGNGNGTTVCGFTDQGVTPTSGQVKVTYMGRNADGYSVVRIYVTGTGPNGEPLNVSVRKTSGPNAGWIVNASMFPALNPAPDPGGNADPETGLPGGGLPQGRTHSPNVVYFIDTTNGGTWQWVGGGGTATINNNVPTDPRFAPDLNSPANYCPVSSS